MREKGIKSDIDHMGRSIKAQLKYADKIGAAYVAVIGESEIESGGFKLKKMSDGSEIDVKIEDALKGVLPI